MYATQVGVICAAMWKSTKVAVKVRSNHQSRHQQHAQTPLRRVQVAIQSFTALMNNTMAAIPQPGTGTTLFAARQPPKGSPLPLGWPGAWAAVAARPLAPVTRRFSPTDPGNRTRGRNRGQQAVGPVRVTRAACNEGYAHCPAGPPLAAQVLPAGAGAAAERLLLLEIDAHSRLRHPRFPRADASVLCFQSADGNKWRRARAGRGGEGA